MKTDIFRSGLHRDRVLRGVHDLFNEAGLPDDDEPLSEEREREYAFAELQGSDYIGG